MERVHITETILRDAHQCLIATRLRTEDMLPACAALDKVGFWALEAWGGATFDSCLRFLQEDPWERLRKLRAALPKTRLSMLLRGQNLLGYRHYPDDVVEHFIERAAANGIDVFRIFDALNDLRNLQVPIKAAKKTGKHVQGAISYTVSPVHRTPEFVKLARALQEMGCDSVAIKDMSGLLTPQAAIELTKNIVKTIDIPLHIHSHATSGLASIAMMEAIKHGCRHIDTALSAFAEGASHPCTESMVMALRGTQNDTFLDEKILSQIADHFRTVREKYKRFESAATRIDPRVHVNQIPGGMISNLYQQLREQNALDKLNAVLAEVPCVRADLGYPPLVTPTSQVVGAQAVLNVLSGKRYGVITNEVKLYISGYYGRAPGRIDSTLQQFAIGNGEIIDCRPADLFENELPQMRQEIGDLAKSEEDILTFAMFPDVARDFLTRRAEGRLEPEPLVLPDAADLPAQAATKFKVTLHGETYVIDIQGSGQRGERERPIYLTVDGMPQELIVEDLAAPITKAAMNDPNLSRPKPTLPGHVVVALPSVVVAILVEEGQVVQEGAPLLVTEAMKMETEVLAPIGGVVKTIYIKKGERVTPEEAVMLIEKV